jgi:photosystem II stability/assembly factor-like uncharacterized protein
MKRILSILVLSSLLGHQPLKAQRRPKSPEIPVAPAAKPLDSVFSQLNWRNVGPFRGGRANAVAGVPGNRLKFFAGYTGGGLWVTEDGGKRWKNVSDGFFRVGTIGDIAVSESDPNVVFVGSGEHAVRGVMTSYGDGVYKSTDGGRSWKHMGLDRTRHISDIIIDPRNPDLVYVAAQGAVHGNNPERGVYRSTDGGRNWQRVLHIDDSTGISSLSMDMRNPRVLYAASWTHRRHPWTVMSGGPGSGLWKSVDGGEHWERLTEGLPKEMGKSGVSVSRANPSRVYAIVETEKSKSGLYRSDDAGKTWALLSNNQDICSRSWYYMEVFADPIDENRVYVLNAPMMQSIDGGKTFTRVMVQHGDTHDLWIHPEDNSIIGLADDGGVEISYDRARTWSSIMNQPTAQFYRVNADMQFPYKLYAGQQDNSSVIVASRSSSAELTERDWSIGPGCESAFPAFDPKDPTLVYGGCYQGYIEVLNTKTGESKDVQAYPSLNLAIQPRDMKYRFNWNAPIIASPHDPKTIYHGGNVLLRSRDGGMSWDAVSPDLTRNDKTRQGPGGGPFTNEGAGGENYNTLTYVIESPLQQGVIWTGSDCGLVQMTPDGGRTWRNVTPAGLEECLIHSIELSAKDPGVAYICATRYKFNDFASYTYRTTDAGASWQRIDKGVMTDDFIRVIREDPERSDILYAGSERAFYLSTDRGGSWQRFQRNLPVVPVTDLIIRDKDLVASTAGRAFWILDDLSPIRAHAGLSQGVKIVVPKASYRYGGAAGLPEKEYSAGQNAPEGVILDYFLPSLADSQTVTLTITDALGREIRRYSSEKDASYSKYPGGPPPPVALPREAGHHRFVWNLRRGNVSPDVKGVFIYGDYRGHMVAPGRYRAVLRVGAQADSCEVELRPNPGIDASAEVWAEQQALLERITGSISEMHRMVNDFRVVKKQLQGQAEMLSDKKVGVKAREEALKVVKSIEGWESRIVEARIQNGQDVINWPSQLNAEFFNLKGLVDVSDPRVTKGVKVRLADLEAVWAKEKAAAEALRKSIKDYNDLYRAEKLDAVVL